ncbi:unnamed protein product [Heterobilharzia americana]|nr:unnamed protein product [Heterobilharzia americana]
MSIAFSNQNYSNSHPDDQELVKQLTDLIRQNIPYSKRLHVLGILSYTSDNGCERFIKIDSSFSAANEANSETSKQHTDYSRPCPTINSCEADDKRSTQNYSENMDTEQHSSAHSPGASPPLLPPSVIQINRAGKPDDRSEQSLSEHTSENAQTGEFDTDGDAHRRCRRKCRKPKRQVFDCDSHVGDSDVEDASTDAEDLVHTSKIPDDQTATEVPRIESHVQSVSDTCMQEIPTVTASNSDVNLISTALSNRLPEAAPSIPAFSTSPTVSSVSFVPMQYATINKYLSPQANSPDITALVNSQLSSGTKYAISAKSLGLGDLGDLCGILPINTLLGKTLISGNDANIPSKLLFTNNIGTPASISGSETVNHSGFSQQMTQCISSIACTNQNLMLNPNLAAAVAAAISNSSLAFSSSNSVVSNGPNLSTNMHTLTAPSIALTGPSGEILGTIPIASANSPQNILSPALVNSVLQPSSINNSLTTVSVALPTNPNTGSSTGLTNTLNWLRCATTMADPGSHQVISNFAPVNNAPSFSVTSGNPVALLHSLVTQQQGTQAQIQKQQSLQSAFSVGPTLALIGTLGLNSPVTCSVSGQHPSETTLTSNTSLPTSVSTILPATLHNSIQASPAGNNAALVAAALLRSLTNVKQPNQELPESNSIDVHPYNPPASLTLITNNIPPSGNVAPTRTNIVGLDESGGSLNSNLANRIAQSTLNVSALSSSLSGITTSIQASNVCYAASNSTQTVSTRGSIMLSYPRGGTEMNLLLTPASAHTFGTSQLAPLTAVPTALSFQGLPTSQPTSLTLNSSVLFHTPVTSTVVQTTNTMSETTTATTSSYMVPPSNQFDQVSRKTDKSLTSTTESNHTVTSNTNQTPTSSPDPTSSAIDRILQTIKGCMNANANRESENKLRIRKNESNGTYQTVSNDAASGHRVNDTKKTTATKFAPVNKNGVSLDSDYVPRSGSTGDRLPLPPLQKSPGESSDGCSSHAINKFYRCRYCGKTFNRKFCRERHERLHTGVKPYSCEICDEKFIRLEDKKRHVRSLQHYLSGRGSLRNSGLQDTVDESVGISMEPSSVLPLLAQTLQGGVNAESVRKETDELCISTDEPNFSCHASENESEGITTVTELEGESYNPEENELCSDDLRSVSQLPSFDGNHTSQNSDTEDGFKAKRSKLEEPSDEFLTSVCLTSKIQLNKSRCRTALKETQTTLNSASENHCEMIKIPTVVIVNTEDATNAKSTT